MFTRGHRSAIRYVLGCFHVAWLPTCPSSPPIASTTPSYSRQFNAARVPKTMGGITRQAQAMPNPHKVRPIVATGIPAGSTYTRPIIVYNPRDAPALSVTEVSEMNSMKTAVCSVRWQAGDGRGGSVRSGALRSIGVRQVCAGGIEPKIWPFLLITTTASVRVSEGREGRKGGEEGGREGGSAKAVCTSMPSGASFVLLPSFVISCLLALAM